jgi:hypothetical protein
MPAHRLATTRHDEHIGLWDISLVTVVPNHLTPESTCSTTSISSAAKLETGPSQAA